MRTSDLPYFFFGTLMDEDVLALVLGRIPPDLRSEPARLDGYRRLRVKGESYPTLRPAADARVDGLLVRDLSQREVNRVAFYEGEEYRLLNLPVTRPDGVSEPALIFAADHGLETDGEWDLARWRETEKPGLLIAARAFMEHFGAVESAATADRRWREARALARRAISR